MAGCTGKSRHYDSFSYNVVAMLEETLGVKVTVMTIDSEWPDSNMGSSCGTVLSVFGASQSPSIGAMMCEFDGGVYRKIPTIPEKALGSNEIKGFEVHLRSRIFNSNAR
jgi:hypothetical protein